MTCNKIPYDTKGDADKAARLTSAHLRKRQHKKDHLLRPYECQWCGKFHLTSQRPKK